MYYNKLSRILIFTSLLFAISISSTDLILRFVISDCDPHDYFNQYDQWINDSNITWFYSTKIFAIVFSISNILIFFIELFLYFNLFYRNRFNEKNLILT